MITGKILMDCSWCDDLPTSSHLPQLITAHTVFFIELLEQHFKNTYELDQNIIFKIIGIHAL